MNLFYFNFLTHAPACARISLKLPTTWGQHPPVDKTSSTTPPPGPHRLLATPRRTRSTPPATVPPIL
jgi:hypothetical protein